jgi:S1-C subfamily serine protease
MDKRTRRSVLAGAAGLAAGLAGCSGGARESPDPVESTESPPDSGSPYETVYDTAIGSVTFIGSDVGSGSGFVHDDVIVTNHHVVAGAETVDIRFESGEWRTAGVTATDIYADLAVLSTNIPDHVASLSFVETVPPVGAEVLALGSPFGLESSVSAGIVSGRNRSLPNEQTGFAIPNTVQTDAGLDPGNSGGPLVTMDGEVAGVAVAGAGTSVGFAVSPLLARRIVPELIESRGYKHPYLGIRLVEVTPAIAAANNLGEVRGVLVVETATEGPAEGTLLGSSTETTIDGRAVPVGGDVIVELAGNSIESAADLGTALALELSPGDRVSATIIRNGERREVMVSIGARPDPNP